MLLNNKLKNDETLDDLLIDNRKIIQNKNLYKFTSDSIRLAKFIKTKPKDRVVELCSGSGIVGIHLALTSKFESLQMVEIQKQLAQMCERSIRMNGLANKIKVHSLSLQGVSKLIGEGVYDVVFCNPPFEKNEIKTENLSEKLAKCEFKVKIFEICEEAKKLLKFGGSFYLCFPANRLFELSNALSVNNFAIKDCSIEFDKNKNARLVLIRASKGGKSDCKIKLFCTEDKL